MLREADKLSPFGIFARSNGERSYGKFMGTANDCADRGGKVHNAKEECSATHCDIQ
jgi:hypothetical protein